METSVVEHAIVVSQEEWLAARKSLLAKEKEFTRQRDAIRAERMKLPWVKVEKEYVFDTRHGRKTLRDLFDGRSQLIINHFMFGPGWEEGCKGCSFGADSIDGVVVHIENHDVTFVAVSRAPLPEIEAYKRRMGWGFKWVSSFDSDFNHDFHVSFTKDELAQGKVFYNFDWTSDGFEELPGHSSFYKDADGNVFHTYSSYARGGELMLSAYGLLDMAPLGRNEHGPHGDMQDWMRHHDKYPSSKPVRIG